MSQSEPGKKDLHTLIMRPHEVNERSSVVAVFQIGQLYVRCRSHPRGRGVVTDALTDCVGHCVVHICASPP